jgi:hypothetical protein
VQTKLAGELYCDAYTPEKVLKEQRKFVALSTAHLPKIVFTEFIYGAGMQQDNILIKFHRIL